MAKVLNHKQMVITVHAVRTDGVPDRFVPAHILQTKLATFLSALRETDKATLSQSGREVYVTNLRTGSAEIWFREEQFENAPKTSAFDNLVRCAYAVTDGDTVSANRFKDVVSKLANLSSGAGKTFSHVTMSLDNEPPVRVDSFFDRQAKRIKREQKKQIEATPYFRGTSEEDFDGVVKEVDLRGRAPLCKIVLSGTGNEIDCTISGMVDEDIREMLNTRAWLHGKSIYDGFSGLPTRFEIRGFRRIKADGDPSSWKGQIKSLEHGEWGEFDAIA